MLMTAANSIAERAALADVMQPDLADLEADVTADLGIAEAQVQVSRVGSVEFADAQLVDSFGVTLKATGLASVEQ